MARKQTVTKRPADPGHSDLAAPALGGVALGVVLVGTLLSRRARAKVPKDWGEPAPLPRDGKVGEFSLGVLLADGGTATVYNGTDPQGQPVAVKIPHRGPLRNKKFVSTFEREAQIGIDLRHPSIVKVLDAGTYRAGGISKIPYFVMEYLEGQELDQILEAGPLSSTEAVGVARGVADALSWAHARGVIHRDISPRNIFVTSRRSIKVMDFGISAVSDRGPKAKKARGLAFGTPEYMAPERTQDTGNADERSDLYALGCVLYEMIAGRPPFLGESPEKTVVMHLRSPIPSLAEQGLAKPDLDAIVMKLLAKDPKHRFQTANEVIARLADLAPHQ
ncbi:MAG: serine/threonine-protein kinase [Vulcanimicrobiota bacterium]